MFSRYLIFVNGETTNLIITALTEYSAREKYFNDYGSASRYNGIGFDSIEARKI